MLLVHNQHVMHIHVFSHIHLNQLSSEKQINIFQIILNQLTVPARISCGQQFNKNGRQTGFCYA
jgi:hypothetical protein